MTLETAYCAAVRPVFPSENRLFLTQYAGQHQQHQAETQQQQQDEVSGQLGGPGEGERAQAGARLSGLQVLLHRVRQAVGLRTVTQLSTSLVDLEGVAHRYVPHLQWKICVKSNSQHCREVQTKSKVTLPS